MPGGKFLLLPFGCRRRGPPPPCITWPAGNHQPTSSAISPTNSSSDLVLMVYHEEREQKLKAPCRLPPPSCFLPGIDEETQRRVQSKIACNSPLLTLAISLKIPSLLTTSAPVLAPREKTYQVSNIQVYHTSCVQPGLGSLLSCLSYLFSQPGASRDRWRSPLHGASTGQTAPSFIYLNTTGGKRMLPAVTKS